MTPSSWERNRWIILASFGIELLAFKLVMPFVPLYVQELGVTDPAQIPLWSGIILGIMPLTVALMLPLWDRMAQRTGRKFQVLRSLVGCILGLAAMAAAQSAFQLLLAYILEGVTAGFYPQMWNLVSTGAPAGGVSEAMSVLQSVSLLVNALGPFLGGVLGDYVGLRTPYVIGAALCLVVLIAMWVGYRDENPDAEAKTAERPEGVPINKVLEVPGLFPILAMAFLSVCFVPGLNPLIPLYLQSLISPGAPVATLAGSALTAGSLAGAGTAVAMGRMTRRWPAGNLVAISLATGGLATALLPVIPSVQAAFLLWIIRSALTGGTIALLYGVADTQLPPHIAKGIYTNITGAMVFGGGIGVFVTGAMGALDLRGAFVAVGVLLMLMGLWATRAFGPHKSAPQ